jgi:putative endonuclease
MYYTYILYSAKIDKFYIGCTSNFELRLIKHNAGTTRFTKQTNDWSIVYSIAFETKSEALKEERRLKKAKNRSYFLFLINKGA